MASKIAVEPPKWQSSLYGFEKKVGRYDDLSINHL